ncbi:DUF503 domain-containing protein [candidate division KSB1 bacterium]|nr:DUF503 domain-containing protein [candidate division KSB1 bacterium]
MLVGIYQVELFIPASGSLKEKRFILKSLKSRIRNKFNVSVAEVADHDKWQRAQLGFAAVSNDRKIIDNMFNEIQKLILAETRVELVDQHRDLY